jgi:hypothetical protein
MAVMDRRRFLETTLICSAGFFMDSVVHSIPLSVQPLEKGFVYFGEGLDIYQFNTESKEINSITADLRAHSFLAFPGHSELILSIEKWRKKICIVDFKTRKIKQMRVAAEDRFVYGHACFSPDGNSIYTIEVDHKTGFTYLVCLESKTLVKTSEFALSHGGAHELAFLPDTSILVVASTGWVPDYQSIPLAFHRESYSGLIFFDTKLNRIVSEKILRDPFLSLAHLKVTNSHDVITISDIMHPFLSDKIHGKIYSARIDQDFQEWKIPQEIKLKGELLSIEINEKKDLIGVTNPLGRKTLVFSLSKRESLYTLETDSKGVGINQNGSLIFSMAPQGSRSCTMPNGSAVVPIPSFGKGASSHMYYVKQS